MVSGARRLAALAAWGALLASSGCVMPDEVARLRKEQADVQQRILELRKEQAAVQEKISRVDAKLADEDGVKRSEFADLKNRIDGLLVQTTRLEDRFNQTDRRIDRLSQEVQAGRDAVRRLASVPPAPATGATGSAAVAGGGEAVPDPEALYNTAYADFSKGNWALAISGFQEYATRFPDSDVADNALYWIGECLFSQGKFGEAVQAFDRMLERYPASDRAGAANLKKGVAYLESNQVSQGIVQLRYVVTTFQGSDEARIARDRLASLGAAVR